MTFYPIKLNYGIEWNNKCYSLNVVNGKIFPIRFKDGTIGNHKIVYYELEGCDYLEVECELYKHACYIDLREVEIDLSELEPLKDE